MTAAIDTTAKKQTARSSTLRAMALAAIARVDDPEYPGVSIVDLGLVESCVLHPDGSAIVGLIPTFSGCPALAVIAADVENALQLVDGVNAVTVNWLRSPVWSAERVTEKGRAALASDFTVAVQIGRHRAECPLCGSATTEQSMFGPSRCRSVHRCETCRETVEVMRA